MAKLKFAVMANGVEVAEHDGRQYSVVAALINGYVAMVGYNPAQHVDDKKVIHASAAEAKRACERHCDRVAKKRESTPATENAELDAYYAEVAKASKTTVDALKARFGVRNNGMQRMQLNMIMKRLNTKG